jgi:ribonuclease HI
VSRDQRGDRDDDLLFLDEPESLPREELIALVHDLRAALSATVVRSTAVADAGPRRNARAAPDADYTVVFDGGSLGNPGRGYGSYEIVGPGGSVAARRLEFGNDVTNNQAEFRALIGGLEDLLARAGPDAHSLSIAVRGDSQLVIRGLTGEWRVKHPGLQPLHRQASDLLRQFGNVDLAWHPRRESVRAFGH